MIYSLYIKDGNRLRVHSLVSWSFELSVVFLQFLEVSAAFYRYVCCPECLKEKNTLLWVCMFSNGLCIKSPCLHCKVGVPWGSILGPIFFSFYIHDLPNVCQNINNQLCADNAVIFTQAEFLRIINHRNLRLFFLLRSKVLIPVCATA